MSTPDALQSVLEAAPEIYGLFRFPQEKFGFPFPGWQGEFGIYSWFYVRGLRAWIEKTEIHTLGEIHACARGAATHCPAVWKKQFPRGNWGSLALPQISKAVKGGSIRFDKACLVILATALATNARAFEEVYIEPAIFNVENLDAALPDAMREHGRNTLQEAADFVGQPIGFVENAARFDYSMTYKSASALAAFFQRQGYFRCEVRMIRQRVSKAKLRPKQPNPVEVVF